MKSLNWGTFTFGLYFSFVAFMGFLIYKAVNQKFDLVTTDYYAKELQYQAQIDATNLAKGLSAALTCELKAGQFVINFPQEHHNQILKGKVHFYCPWAAENDKTLEFNQQVAESLPLNLPTMIKGKYNAIIDWEANGQKFHTEQTVFF